MLRIWASLFLLQLILIQAAPSLSQAATDSGWRSFLHASVFVTSSWDSLDYRSLGLLQTQRFERTLYRLDSRNFRSRAWGLRLVGLVNTTEVLEVEVRLRNGDEFSLPELIGPYPTGRRREVILGGHQVREVVVTATSGNATGHRARLRVDLGLIPEKPRLAP